MWFKRKESKATDWVQSTSTQQSIEPLTKEHFVTCDDCGCAVFRSAARKQPSRIETGIVYSVPTRLIARPAEVIREVYLCRGCNKKKIAAAKQDMKKTLTAEKNKKGKQSPKKKNKKK